MPDRNLILRAPAPTLRAACFAAAVLACLGPALIPAEARGGQTGREFLELCSARGAWTDGYCTGDVAGAGELIDGLLLEKDLKAALDGKAFCLPDGLRKDQVRDLVLDYLRERPEIQDSHIASITWATLIDAFPCG